MIPGPHRHSHTILTFTTHIDKGKFESQYESHEEIHEIYTPTGRSVKIDRWAVTA